MDARVKPGHDGSRGRWDHFPLCPDRARGIDDEPQLGALVRLAQGIAGDAAGEAALRADRQAVEIDVPRSFVGAAAQDLEALERRRLAADEAEHRALALRNEAQRRKIARARRVVFEQEVVDAGAPEQPLGRPIVSALGEIAALEVAAAEVDADDDLARA